MLMGRALISNLRKMTTNLKGMIGYRKKKRGPCFVCGKVGRNSTQIKFRKGDPLHSKPLANLAESEIIVVVSEVNLVNNLSE